MADEFDPRYMPRLSGSMDFEEEESKGIFGPGLRAGWNELQAMGGAAALGAGKAIGASGVMDYGREVVARNMAEAEAAGRSDLNVAPWREGGADVLPWLGYQAAKQLPILGAYMLGGKAYRMTGAQAPAIAEGIGMNLPRALGGAGLLPGASFAARREAVRRGARSASAEMGQDLTGGMIAGLPLAYGSMIQEADQKPGGLTYEDTIKAAALSPIYSALDAVQPAALKGLLKKGQTGNLLGRVGRAMFAGAAAEVPQEGMQTGLEMLFRPDLSLNEKMHNIVDAAVTGGAVGGVFGGVGGIRKMKVMDPATITTEDLDEAVSGFQDQPDPMDNFTGAAAQPWEEPGQLPAPGDESFIQRGETDPVMVAQRNREAGRFAPGQTITETPGRNDFTQSEFDVPRTETPGPYSGWTDEQLVSGVSVLNRTVEEGNPHPAVEKHLEPMKAELAARNLTAIEEGVPGTAGAAARDLSQLGGAEQTAAEPASATPDEFAARRAELVGNVKRLPASIREELANARSEDEVRAIAVREANKTDSRGKLLEGVWRKNLGKSTGILDETGKPTALYSEISEKVAAAEEASAVANREPRSMKDLDIEAQNATSMKDLDILLRNAGMGVEPSGAPTGVAEPTTVPGTSREEIGTTPSTVEEVRARNAGIPVTEAAPAVTPEEFAALGETGTFEGLPAVERNALYDNLYENHPLGRKAAKGTIEAHDNGRQVALGFHAAPDMSTLTPAQQTAYAEGFAQGRAAIAASPNHNPAAGLVAAAAPAQAATATAPAPKPETQEQFAKVWKKATETLGTKTAGLKGEVTEDTGLKVVKKAGRPKTRAQAQRMLYNLLGRERKGKDAGEVGEAIEKLAQEFGVLDENLVLTPLGVAIAETEPIAREEQDRVAKELGFTGPLATQFRKGVQDHLNRAEVPNFRNPANERAYLAGRGWAMERNAVPSGALEKYDPTKHSRTKITQADVEEMGKDKRTPPKGGPVPAEQLRQQYWNNAIDDLGITTTVSAAELPILKRMVVNGASNEQMAEAIAMVKTGEKLFTKENEEREEPGEFVGVRIDAISRDLKDLKQKVADRLAHEKDMESQAKGLARREIAETKKSKAHAERKAAILVQTDAAFTDGLITAHERLDIINAVVRNDLQLAEDMLAEANDPSTLPDEVNPDLLADQTSSENQQTLTEEYGQPEFNNEVRARFSLDVQAYLAGKLAKISAVVRGIIRETLAAVAAIAFVFSTVGLSPITSTKAMASATTSTRVVVTTEVPENARAGMSEVAQQTYRIYAPMAMETGKGFQIADKPNGMIHIFGRDGRLISTGPALYGLTPGDEIVRGVSNQASGLKVTPGGVYEIRFERSDYKGGKLGRLYERGSSDKMALGGVAIHSVYMGNPSQNRVGRLSTGTAEDNRISAGCINTTEETFVEQIVPNIEELDGGLVIIIPENGNQADFLKTNTAELPATPLTDTGQQEQLALAAGMAVTTRDARKRKNEASRRRHEARQRRAQGQASAGRAAPLPPSAAETNSRVGAAVRGINDTADRAMGALGTYGNMTSVGKRMLSMMVGWMPLTHMVEQYNKIMPQLKMLFDAHVNRRAVTAVFAHLYNAPKLLVEKMKQSKEGRKALETISWLMEFTAHNIDYSKTWEENEHLHGEENVDFLKDHHRKGYSKYQALKDQGHHKLIDDYRRINETEHYTSMLLAIRRLIAFDKASTAGIASMAADPMDRFLKDSSKHNPVEARKFWRKELEDLVGEVEAYTTSVRGTEVAKEVDRIKPLAKYTNEVKKGIVAMDEAPYFHLGRSGEHYVFGSARLTADGKVDHAALEHIALVLEREAGVTDARISKDLNKPQIFLRFDTPERRAAVAGVMQKLWDQGWLNPDVPVTAGPREKGQFMPERTKAEMNRFLEAFKNDPFFDPEPGASEAEIKALSDLKSKAMKVAFDVWLDLLPDTATSKVLTHREGKSGYSKDMARSFAYRYNIGVNSIASLSAEPQINAAFDAMRDQLEKAKIYSNNMDVDTIATLYAENAKREAQRPLASANDVYDRWRAWSHSFYLGLSPSYMLVNLTQMGVLLWPELSKNFGFVDTARAMAKVTPLAFKILKATMEKGYEAGGFLRAADGVITQEALQEALGTDVATTKFMMSMIGSGLIDIGSAARELATMAEGSTESTEGKMLRFAASAGLYSETFTRLVAALSARELYESNPGRITGTTVTDYAQSVTRESMLEYSTWNSARLMGKMGFAGGFTPVMMSFLQYSTQVTWKLYRELTTAFMDKSATADDKKAARKFLLNHLVAVTTLAGTLGLPFATVGALVIEKMVDAMDDDDEPFDASAAWRNYLAEVFGKDVGEMAARGVPRAFGIDLSGRVGEQNLFPQSQWLTDRRKWKEATSEAALRSIGAPFSMLGSIATGAAKISEGDFLGGATEMMPTAFKGGFKSYQMSTDGYRDMQGNQLPMTPKASAYLAQLLGFTPAEKAEYSEVRGDQARRRGELTDQARVLRDGIVDAILAGDRGEARRLYMESRSFDKDNPKFAIGPDIEDSLKRRLKLQRVSAATNTPIGVAPDDFDAQRLTAYGNIDYAAQR